MPGMGLGYMFMLMPGMRLGIGFNSSQGYFEQRTDRILVLQRFRAIW